MIQQDIQITNRLGLHARPAASIAQTAAKFACDIKLTKDHVTVNAKSIMGVMMLAAEFGSHVQLTTDGSDEKEAFEAIKKLFDDKFNEEF
ncbi:HPr family phosphocarrier protein [Candidatus Avelusimicrobium gallicola]|uniref:Phosphocarrier protein HPr n=1 Tax=Candidatus Avelusimicrobium gallicola TaxID=2562704 RepID=A0A1Y4DQC5_9BACT|nr:HPr family phosphocarrier protein [Elusimicrobium sp. An273]OUO57571.1 phosphocarrier protein HPr [Elusimicrobium sp. An273]